MCLQGLMFNVLWRLGMDWWESTEQSKAGGGGGK